MANTLKIRQQKKIEKLSYERIISILSDPDSSNADAMKAIALFCDHLREESENHAIGDVEIHLREENT